MRHGSLFSGIGGFDLAAEWMEWENVFHCEWNEFGQKVLKHYWPNAESFGDITKTNFSKYYGTVDVISGGFPCQPYSNAGKRLGKEDERHLWPEMCRAIREIAPRWVVGENVRGLTNWNGGMVFDEVCTDLENLGYKVAPYLIPASGVNAPHKRERIWFIAYSSNRRTEAMHQWAKYKDKPEFITYSDSNGLNECNGKNEIDTSKGGIDAFNDANANDERGNASYATSERLERVARPRIYWESNGFASNHKKTNWSEFPTQSPICSGDDGIPRELDGITFSKWRAESIKAYGNAVCPNVVFEIFKSIQAYENIL